MRVDVIAIRIRTGSDALAIEATIGTKFASLESLAGFFAYLEISAGIACAVKLATTCAKFTGLRSAAPIKAIVRLAITIKSADKIEVTCRTLASSAVHISLFTIEDLVSTLGW